MAGLILSGYTLYGTAQYGGSAAMGTVFAINTDGTGFTNLHNFSGTTFDPRQNQNTNSDGANPSAGLVMSGGTLYGAAYDGGSRANGTLFAISTNGTSFTNFHSLSPTDGAGPEGLIVSGNTLYGTTYSGGYAGTVFKVSTDGTGFMTLHSFTGGTNGEFPLGGLILSGNTLYGTTRAEVNDSGTLFKLNTDSTGFTTLHYFKAPPDAGVSYSGLILSGNNLYGAATDIGGDLGTIFKLNTDGTGFTNLYSFTNGHDGYFSPPDGGLILSGYTIYGTTASYGNLGVANLYGFGTVFSLSFAPQLTITPSLASVILTWPTNVAGFDYSAFTLQSTTNLVPAAWSAVSPAPVVVNGQYTVTNPISGTQQFYQLSQ